MRVQFEPDVVVLFVLVKQQQQQQQPPLGSECESAAPRLSDTHSPPPPTPTD